MPWCPKCKNEYRKGIRVCADCGMELVEDDMSVEYVPITFGEEEQLKGLQGFLEYHQYTKSIIEFSKQDGVYELKVPKPDREQVEKMTKAFMIQLARKQQQAYEEAMQNGSEPEDEKEDGIVVDKFSANGVRRQTTAKNPSSYGLYESNSDKAENNRSSGWMLLTLGILGLVVVVLCMVGVIPFRPGSAYLFYGVMSAMFLLFVVMGVVSMKNARIFAGRAESENSLRATMQEWCRDNLKKEELDAQLGGTQGISEEVLYFRRFALLKERLNHQFMNLDQSFLESFIDNYVYDSVFESHDSEA